MNIYDGLLQFKGTWRSYQERVLKHADAYLKNEKMHIVAPPGSGKTTLGIELIRRLGEPALILSPRLVIREQWLERIREAFLMHPDESGILSHDVKSPGLITSITYQTLYSGMMRCKNRQMEELSAAAVSMVMEEDYTGFDLIQTVKDAGIRVVCLDECHHLRSEWWNTLEKFMEVMEQYKIKVISLTATPPYDSNLQQWERYVELCGTIDEEIIVPELVREKSLCPHQDYVYFNFPTKEEEKKVGIFKKRAQMLIADLMGDEVFSGVIATHKYIKDYTAFADKMLEEPAYLSSLLIFFDSKNIFYDKRWKKLLGMRHLPEMNCHWMEILLQKFLYDDTDHFICDKAYQESLILRLKEDQFIVRRKVGLVCSENIQKLLINSLGKIQSIKAIVKAESDSMKKDLRMLVLTDYIRQEYKAAIGHPEKEIKSIGVLPLFEILRRERNSECRLGVLCGSMIILPTSAVPYLKSLVKRHYGRSDTVTARQFSDDSGMPLEYAQVEISGNRCDTTKLVTEVFEAGHIQILIGTKSLLGEGWDSPCINSLILASFVGSYVLSNQMRGRAIRVMPDNPQKTSNIWHLVCIENQRDARTLRWMGVDEEELSIDFSTLKRRMKGFIGVSYDGNTIENGLERLSIISGPYNQEHIQDINKKMVKMAGNRELLRSQWEEAVGIYEKMETLDEFDIHKEELKTKAAFFNILGLMIVDAAVMVSYQAAISGMGTLKSLGLPAMITGWVIWMLLAGYFGKLAWRAGRYLTPYRYLEQIGKGIQRALEDCGQIESKTRVEADDDGQAWYQIYLKGGTVREKEVFSNCVEEFFGVIDNQRYLLYNKHAGIGMSKYYCVPKLFAKSREEAQLFALYMKKSIGKSDIIYTRNPEGRKILLKARARSFANLSDRQLKRLNGRRHVRVKGALE